MWSIVKAILLKLGMLRGLIAVLGSLAALLPIAIALIKLVGWPLLLVLFVLALPLLLVLALIGFPLIAVVGIAGVVLSTLYAMITAGMIALKFALFVVLPIWIAWRLARWAFSRRGGGERQAPEAPTGAEASP
ncbi:MAG: hypothetical protein ABR499_07750 [Gemmatimonadaceae bacterium]